MRAGVPVPERDALVSVWVSASAWLASLRWRLTTALVVSVAYVLIPCLIVLLANVAPAPPPPPPPPPPTRPARSPPRRRTLHS